MRYKKVVFTSPVQPIAGCSPDVYSWDKRPARIRTVMCFINHPGLSFLGANLPIEILEYPDDAQFDAMLEDPPDVLGISFYINETESVFRMIRKARARGVKEIWGGNFGAYSDEIAPYFDRVITGWGEQQVAQALEVEAPAPHQLKHPAMYGAIGSSLSPRMFFSGLLFTSRGCPFPCTYCQTPDFYGKAQVVPLESIDRVLWEFQRNGVYGVNILDENFGIFPAHSKAVIDLLHKYRFRWMPLARVDLMLKNFDEWREKGLFGAHLGVESLNQDSLNDAEKRLDQGKTLDLLRLMSKHNMLVQAFYMIGFENETVASIRRDILELAKLDIDVPQVQVITPYPRTPMRDKIIEQYGIWDANFSHYNSRNMVWNHPNISWREMKDLQIWANRLLVSSKRSLRTLSKVFCFYGTDRFSADGLRYAARAFSPAMTPIYREYAPRLVAAQRWGKRGWYGYEETAEIGPRPDKAAATIELVASTRRQRRKKLALFDSEHAITGSDGGSPGQL